jgi:hypothetical protein
MTDPATILASARLGWQLLAKIPWLTRWVLRHFFPISKCKALFQVDVPGNHARFELLSIRPSPALVGLEVRVYNPLPFAVEFETFRLTANIDGTGVLNAVLNTKHCIPATGSAHVALPEIGLSDSEANWVRERESECVRLGLELHWRCKSTIHDWQDQGTYTSLVYVNRDRGEGPQA